MDDSKIKLHCVAQLPPKEQQPVEEFKSQSARTGQWTADGTSIVQVHADNAIETIVLPEDLLKDEKNHELKPYSYFESKDPIYSTATYPHFTLQNPSTTLVLYAARDHPIQLRNALNYSEGVYATYSWIDKYTEAYIAPHSLVFPPDAKHFVAGSKAQFAVYDVNTPSAGPVRIRKTSKSRYALKTFGADPATCATGPNSIVTTMDTSSSEDILALGTNTRDIALYANHGLGDLITSFKLPAVSNGDSMRFLRGVTQVRWSPDGTYLFVAGRQSDIIEVYDVRQSCRRLGWCSGRVANANFQMAFDIAPTIHGLEIWAGGMDGHVRMWRHPEQQEGEVKPAMEWDVHDDAVCATLVHTSGSVVATLATKDRHADHETEPTRSFDDEFNASSSLKETFETPSDHSEMSECSDSSSAASDVEPPSPRLDAMLKIWSIC